MRDTSAEPTAEDLKRPDRDHRGCVPPGQDGHAHGGGHALGHADGRQMAHHDELPSLLLGLLLEKPACGYELISSIQERFADACLSRPERVYPTLMMLEDMGHVTLWEITNEGKRVYSITTPGRKVLEAGKPLFAAGSGHDLAFPGATDASVLRSAMQNLQATLRRQPGSPAYTDEQIRTVVDALHEAARKIAQA